MMSHIIHLSTTMFAWRWLPRASRGMLQKHQWHACFYTRSSSSGQMQIEKHTMMGQGCSSLSLTAWTHQFGLMCPSWRLRLQKQTFPSTATTCPTCFMPWRKITMRSLRIAKSMAIMSATCLLHSFLAKVQSSTSSSSKRKMTGMLGLTFLCMTWTPLPRKSTTTWFNRANRCMSTPKMPRLPPLWQKSVSWRKKPTSLLELPSQPRWRPVAATRIRSTLMLEIKM